MVVKIQPFQEDLMKSLPFPMLNSTHLTQRQQITATWHFLNKRYGHVLGGHLTKKLSHTAEIECLVPQWNAMHNSHFKRQTFLNDAVSCIIMLGFGELV